MLGDTPFLPKGADSRNVPFESLLFRPICSWCQLDDSVEWNFHPRRLLLRYIHVVSVDASQNCLMRNNDDVLASFQLHDDGLQPDDDVSVAFAPAISVIVLVIIPSLEIFRIPLFNFRISKAVADARVEFIQGFPFELGVAFGRVDEEACGLDRSLECGCPDREMAVITD